MIIIMMVMMMMIMIIIIIIIIVIINTYIQFDGVVVDLSMGSKIVWKGAGDRR